EVELRTPSMTSIARKWKVVIIPFVVVTSLCTAAGLSWFTTYFAADHSMPGGDRLSVVVQDAHGRLIQRARLRVNVSGRRPSIMLFQNVRGDTIATDTGALHLDLPQDGWEYGSSGWDLFWCVRIWDNAPLPDRISFEVSADGYRPQRVTGRELLERKSLVVALRDGDD
ncbi:MAG: hypothetical protein WBF17_21955, partial [Phycisphaerae bacterium]